MGNSRVFYVREGSKVFADDIFVNYRKTFNVHTGPQIN